jgi:hypothetical protein
MRGASEKNWPLLFSKALHNFVFALSAPSTQRSLQDRITTKRMPMRSANPKCGGVAPRGHFTCGKTQKQIEALNEKAKGHHRDRGARFQKLAQESKYLASFGVQNANPKARQARDFKKVPFGGLILAL